MAITTQAGCLSGLRPPVFFAKGVTPTMTAGVPQSLWYVGGSPNAGAAPSTSTSGGVTLSSSSALVTGQLYHQDPSSGNSYLGRFSGVSSVAGQLLLCDRLLHCSSAGGSAISVTSTASQTIDTNLPIPSRDQDGGTTGYGVQCAIEVSTVLSGASGTINLAYGDASLGAASTVINTDTIPASAPVGTFIRFGLFGGALGAGTGCELVNGLTLSAAWTSGAIVIVLYRVLATLELRGAFIPNYIDCVESGFPQLWNGVVPFLVFIPSVGGTASISGSYTEAQG